MTYRDTKIVPSKYCGISAAMNHGIEKILAGESTQIPKGTLAGAVRLLRLAHGSFHYDGFAVNHEEVPQDYSESMSARELVLRAYTTVDSAPVNDEAAKEAKVRTLLHLTENINSIRIPTRQGAEYLELMQFYRRLKEIGNQHRYLEAMGVIRQDDC